MVGGDRMSHNDGPRMRNGRRDEKATRLIEAEQAARPPTGDRSLSVQELRSEIQQSVQMGMVLPDHIYDESGVLLLAAGQRVTTRFLQLLSERNISRVQLRSAQAPPPATGKGVVADAPRTQLLHSPSSRELDRRLSAELTRPVFFRPVVAWRRPRLAVDALMDQAARGVKKYSAASIAVTDMYEALKVGRRVSANELRQSVTGFVDAAAADFDLLPLIISMQKSKDEYLCEHSVKVSLLSVAIALQLGLDRETVGVIGLGALMHDVGMLRVPASIRLAERELTERERIEIQRHPIHTVDMLANLRGISPAVKFIGYQTHERIDGGGYPHRRARGQLHRYAEIVSLADVYVAMTCRRPHRPPMNPHTAVKTILLDASANRFDPVLVRAFLDTVSAFPTGSRVELDNGGVARVIRATPGLHTRPVVEALTAGGKPTGRIIDLSRGGAPRIIRAV